MVNVGSRFHIQRFGDPLLDPVALGLSNYLPRWLVGHAFVPV